MRTCLPNCVLSSRRKPRCLTSGFKPFSTIHSSVSPAASPTTSSPTNHSRVCPTFRSRQLQNSHSIRWHLMPIASKDADAMLYAFHVPNSQNMQMHERGMELGTIPPVAKPRNPSTTTRSKFSSQAATVFSNRFSHRDGWHHSPRLAVWGKRQWNIIKQLFLLVLSRLHKPSPSGS